MGETANIATMAEDISDSIFSKFKWEKHGPMNENWECVCPEDHKKKTHPSDVVFQYKEPYKQNITCVNTDLKSYTKGSITTTQIKDALENLDKSVKCAKVCNEWQTLYAPTSANFDVCGLLFIYNHDGEYDKDFYSLLNKAARRIKIAPKNKLFVLSPYDVCYLKSVTNDIMICRAEDGDKKLPPSEHCSFFYPTSSRYKHAFAPHELPATLEMLTSPWQILRYSIDGDPSKGSGLSIYMKTRGETKEEFMYLIDYLCNYQLLSSSEIISVNLPNAHTHASVHFKNATDEYIKMRNDFSSEKIRNIKMRTVTNIVTNFSSVEIGMRYE